MTLPEFRPQSYKRGEVVQVRRDGQVVVGRVIRQTAAGNYWIENQDGHEILVEKNDVFPGQIDDRENLATDANIAARFQHQIQNQPGQQSETVKPTFQNPTEGVTQTFVDSIKNDDDYDPFVLKPNERAQVESPQQDNQENQSTLSSLAPSSTVDAVQATLDAAGVVDPTPVSDGTNAILSLGRAIKNPRNAGKHLKNAAVSAVSMIPYVGDLAKGVKYGGKATKATKATVNAQEAAEAVDAVKASGNIATSGDDLDTREFVDSIFRPKNNGQSGNGRSGRSGGNNGSGGGPNNPGGPSDPDDENIRKNLGGLKDAVVDVTGKLGKLGAATYTFAEAQNFLNKAVIEYNRNLLKYNGELTKAYSELDFGRLSREFRQAQKQSGPMSGLIGAQNDLEESMMNFRGDWQVIATDIQTGLTKLADIGIRVLDYISPLEEMYGLIRKWLPWGKPDTQKFDGNAAIKELDAWRNKAADAQNRGRKV